LSPKKIVPTPKSFAASTNKRFSWSAADSVVVVVVVVVVFVVVVVVVGVVPSPRPFHLFLGLWLLWSLWLWPALSSSLGKGARGKIPIFWRDLWCSTRRHQSICSGYDKCLPPNQHQDSWLDCILGLCWCPCGFRSTVCNVCQKSFC